MSILSAVCRMSDSGGGIEHELLERIWEYGSTTRGVTEKWSDHHIFDRILSSKAADSFYGWVTICDDISAQTVL